MTEIRELILSGNDVKESNCKKFINLERLNLSENEI